MRRMRAARRTEFLDHEFLGLLLLVLASRVVAPFATIARQSYQISHRSLIASLPIEPRICGPEDQSRARRDYRQILQAHDGIRTRDLFLTKEVLYRLSYMGPIASRVHAPRPLEPARLETVFLERETGFEPATPSLEGSRSTN
jgi:hypothetical protein